MSPLSRSVMCLALALQICGFIEHTVCQKFPADIQLTPLTPRRLIGPPTFSTRKSKTATNLTPPSDQVLLVSASSQQFGLDLYALFSDIFHENNYQGEFMISPFGIWSLLLLLMEGAGGNTLKELQTALHVGDDLVSICRAYNRLQEFLKVETPALEISTLQALYYNKNQPLQRDYENQIARCYGSQPRGVDFSDPNSTYLLINEEVRLATRGLIQHSVLPQDLKDANLFMLSSLSFKGRWRHPFNYSLTRNETFYDEEGNPKGTVEMMVQESNFNYAGLTELEGHVLELPYGNDDKYSMLIILPRRGVTLNKVIHNLRAIGIAALTEKLDSNAVNLEDENVEVFLPKFSHSSDFHMPSILRKLNIIDVFDVNNANLSRMAPDYFVSKMIHTTKIIVNEAGTEAASVTTATLANKAQPPKFYLNRPFLYLIIERSTNFLLFTGQFVNPNRL